MLVVLILGCQRQRDASRRTPTSRCSRCSLLIIFDLFRLRFRLRRELTARFPDAPQKGTTYYAVIRSMQMRFMRLPKAQVKVGQQLPEHYR